MLVKEAGFLLGKTIVSFFAFGASDPETKGAKPSIHHFSSHCGLALYRNVEVRLHTPVYTFVLHGCRTIVALVPLQYDWRHHARCR